MKERECKQCGNIFTPKSPRQYYCKKEIIKKCPVCNDEYTSYCHPDAPTTCSKKECKKRAGYIASTGAMRKCKLCGREFKPTSSTQEYCNLPTTKTCAVCGKEFTIKCTGEALKTQTCSEECANKLASMHRQESYMQQIKICELCGEEFHPKSNTQKVCEREHFSKCVVCGKEFKLNYKSAIGQVDLRKTCSDECYRKQFLGKNPFENKESLEKYKATNKERYGVSHPMQSTEIKNKVFATYQDRTGYDHPSHNPNTLKGKNLQVSSIEQKVATAFQNNNIEFEQQKQVSKNNIHHKFDFYLPKYKMYVDVDGVYYHGYLDDSNGEQISEDRDAIRVALIEPDEYYFVIIESNINDQIIELINQVRSIDANTFNYSEYMFNWCRSIEFPYPIYTEDRLKKDYNSLCNRAIDTYNSACKLGLSSIRHFHKSIFDAKVNNSKSLREAWNDDEILKKVIQNRMIYKNNVDPSKILAGFYISKIIPKVSVFNPILAKYLTLKYLNEFNEVLDPFSGFSGRLLGVTSTGKHYVGSDYNEIAVTESNEIICFHQLDAEVGHQNILTANKIEGQCLLTCPPYYKKETYSNEAIYKHCDEWIDLVLENYDCKKYVFVVDDPGKYSDYVVEDILTKSYFSDVIEKVIVIIKG